MSQLVMNGSTALDPPRGPAEAARLITADFDRLYRSVHRYLLHRFFDAELAEELTAQTFYRLATTLATFRGDARQLETWLFRTATNLGNTHLRRVRLRRLVLLQWARRQPSAIPPPDAASPDSAAQARVRMAISSLPSKYQTAVVLRYYSAMSFEDIAVVLNCRPDAVRKRVSRGLEKLRFRLDTPGGA